MLEQAVIDAQNLKEAAIKNAEQEVLAKYSSEIKEAVDALLEQDDDPFAGEEMAMDNDAPVERDEIVDELPMKAMDGEKACPCPSEEEEIEIDLPELIALSQSEEPEEIPMDNDMMFESSEEELLALLTEDEEEVVEEKLKNPEKADLDDDGKLSDYEKARGAAIEKSMDDEGDKVEEELELDEETLKAAIEEILNTESLTVDLKNQPRGAIGTTHPTEGEQVRAVEVAAAADEDTEMKEQNEEFEEAVKKIANLEEQVKSLKTEKNSLVAEHDELKSLARQVSEKLTELNTTNAKLVYQNRILESSSLNERQKSKLVEAISNANSPEEAKVIFETLQESLTSKVQEAPKNLSEAVSKNSRLILKSNKKEAQAGTSAAARMKKLAGII
tara:strand:- start:28 stop:1191 length:1164 start_codon:yes stop_codon:yes gene_type:complete